MYHGAINIHGGLYACTANSGVQFACMHMLVSAKAHVSDGHSLFWLAVVVFHRVCVNAVFYVSSLRYASNE